MTGREQAARSAPPTALVFGGARSGKSRFAERLAGEGGRPVTYVATAEARDAEMAARVAAHRARRGAGWRTVEEPLALAEAIGRHAAPGRAVLVDCLTLWLSNLIERGHDVALETARLEATLRDAAGPVVLVSNEVGSGIVPINALARRFADEQGVLNQRIAAAVSTVVLVAAGLPLLLKPRSGPEISL
ncbi:bifunctional adenosylcobinamide kinase/adenosylcobinamide-phosphate guanylyltransferase [Prosthecomicrobium pneumaticum]|uniref:Bifunctional adenosylcobalamin biosynthesis protein n=1 Tax=Prosthecomicrobium pneumaticum TaxID=81895 RepID=A0A7W9FPN6_9HYPH|nr:bifunctional adenosylcobinamide kinase/adenosylcobinamide-phosphate guanylyltransferase [Prosthecomicrobium pneumaticum]MBB5754573.1 adenosylcobinamide kinase/adenosylcobinamide-phosphate guanylyltransferase [Prosthecomicrobium pneumaticum]